MQGQSFMGQRALAARLVDSIQPDIESMAAFLAPARPAMPMRISG